MGDRWEIVDRLRDGSVAKRLEMVYTMGGRACDTSFGTVKRGLLRNRRSRMSLLHDSKSDCC